MIKSFKDKITENLFHGVLDKNVKKLPKDLAIRTINKLDILNAASKIDDLMVLPGNRLEKLKGDLKDFYSIRVNIQHRIIFKWKDDNAFEVSLTDYH